MSLRLSISFQNDQNFCFYFGLHLAHFCPFNPFWSILLNFIRYDDFSPYVNKEFFLNLFSFSLLYSHIHLKKRKKKSLRMCFFPFTWLTCDHFFPQMIRYVIMILRMYIIWIWIDDLIWYNTMWWKLNSNPKIVC